MHIRDLNGKHICILGFGREGRATLGALSAFAKDCTVTIADQNEAIEVDAHYATQLGTKWLLDLEKFDVIIKSPGIPPKPELDAVKEKITTATNIFLDSIAETGAKVIGVTGSKGKSTTTTLIYRCLKEGGKDAVLCGNIGVPAIEKLSDAHDGTMFVMELSSYQLMDTTVSPHIAVITAFFPEHLDYHGSVEAYFEAKAHITKFQTKDDMVFFASDSEGAATMAMRSAGEKIPFAKSDAPVAIEDTKLKGDHNLSNIAAAFKVATHCGISLEDCLTVFTTFEGLPHRLQSLGVQHDIEWIDDAISTTPESTIAALKALGARVQTLILGGQDRGYDFAELAKEIVEHTTISTCIFFPGSGAKIRSTIEKYLNTKNDHKMQLVDVTSMEEAVNIAKKSLGTSHAALGTSEPICLLSTASPSYGMFKNFEEKGTRFAEYIHKS